VVRTLTDRWFAAGEHRIVWDGAGDDGRLLPNGVSFARLRFDSRGFEAVRRVTVVKR
jgi:hypothetical protein